MRYRRARVPGGCYFFTLVTHQRCQLFGSEAAVNLLRTAFRSVMRKHPFSLDAIVVLPDHLHCIWTLPPGDADFARRWRLVKTAFTRRCSPAWYGGVPPATPVGKQGRQVWQRRYWEHVIRDEDDFRAHVDYIHYNPVRHGYVNRPADWAWSSFGRFVRRGVLASDWGATEICFAEGVGRE
ncbi:MAG TPA: transposase [Gammaproteobacteria bacterium]|nr:transposase [Gammaproteobacteria bacterium]